MRKGQRAQRLLWDVRSARSRARSLLPMSPDCKRIGRGLARQQLAVSQPTGPAVLRRESPITLGRKRGCGHFRNYFAGPRVGHGFLQDYPGHRKLRLSADGSLGSVGIARHSGAWHSYARTLLLLALHASHVPEQRISESTLQSLPTTQTFGSLLEADALHSHGTRAGQSRSLKH